MSGDLSGQVSIETSIRQTLIFYPTEILLGGVQSDITKIETNSTSSISDSNSDY